MDESLSMLGAIVSDRVLPQTVPVDAWPGLIRLALRHGLGPMLLWSVKRRAPEITAAPEWNPLVTVARRSAVSYVLLDNSQRRFQAALDGAGIPAIWLKGIALAKTVYPQPALRSMSDLDVLVPYDQRLAALDAAQRQGFQLYNSANKLLSRQERQAWHLSHHYELRDEKTNASITELHFYLLGPDKSLLPLDRMGWFWEQTQTVGESAARFTIFKPEANLLYLAAHTILQHGEALSYLRQYYDINLVIAHDALRWDLVIDQAVILGWAYATARALTRASEHFGASVPAEVFAQLRARRPTHDHVARAVRLQSRGARWEQTRATAVSLSFTNRVRLGLKILLPTRNYMRRRYAIPPSRSVWPYYPYRWLDQGKDITIWAWKWLVRRRNRPS